MDKGGSDAPSPDPNIGKAALAQATTGQQWLQFAQDAFKVSTARQGELDKLSKRVQEQQLGVAEQQFGWAKEDRDRYKKTFQPVEDAFVKEAGDYGSVARQQEAAAEAQADVSTSAAAARGTARREAAAAGITPGSGRYAGIERAGELGTALAGAGAQNTARTARRDKALALKADVANLGRGLPAQSAQATQLGLGAGTGAYNIGSTNQQISMMPAQQAMQGYGGAMQGYSGQANTLSNLYGLQLDAWKTQQEQKNANTEGMFGALGSIAGMFSFGSDKKAKKNIKPIKKGKALKAVKNMPVKTFDYKKGQGDGGTGHTGTMAQDFSRETGSGDTKAIRFQDAIGITMKAVQDLDAKVEKMGKQLGISAPALRRSSQSPAKARTGKPAKAAKTYKPPAAPSKQLGIG